MTKNKTYAAVKSLLEVEQPLKAVKVWTKLQEIDSLLLKFFCLITYIFLTQDSYPDIVFRKYFRIFEAKLKLIFTF